MRRNGYLGAFGQKFNPAIHSGYLGFLLDGYISNIWWRLQHIGLFAVSVHNVYLTLWPWPSTFWPWRCVMNWASYIQHTYQFLESYDYLFLSYGFLNLITLPSHGTATMHAPCHVNYHRGREWTTFLKSLTRI